MWNIKMIIINLKIIDNISFKQLDQMINNINKIHRKVIINVENRIANAKSLINLIAIGVLTSKNLIISISLDKENEKIKNLRIFLNKQKNLIIL